MSSSRSFQPVWTAPIEKPTTRAGIVRAAIDAAGDGLKEVGKKASMLVTGLIVAATVAVGVGVTVAIIRASPKRRARSLYASRRTAAIEADESDDE